MLRKEGKVRRAGGLLEPEKWKVCGLLLIGLYQVCICVCDTGAVSLAGAQNNLWAVEGGNKLVCSGLLKIANANLLQAKVISVSLLHSGT